MHSSPTDGLLLTPPDICELSQVDLAHKLMQQHRDCRVEQCAWKHVAYRTLVHFGRIEPPRLSPRQRAHRHGTEFPSGNGYYRAPVQHSVPEATFQQVLDGLTALVNDLSPNNSHDG